MKLIRPTDEIEIGIAFHVNDIYTVSGWYYAADGRDMFLEEKNGIIRIMASKNVYSKNNKYVISKTNNIYLNSREECERALKIKIFW